ncbi:unnamed protein product [Symbiodinium sp. KB8]|nr:unnamed protein product [Symbiodinium sp. KB8]
MKDSELFVEDAIGDWACKHEVLDRTEIKYVIRRPEMVLMWQDERARVKTYLAGLYLQRMEAHQDAERRTMALLSEDVGIYWICKAANCSFDKFPVESAKQDPDALHLEAAPVDHRRDFCGKGHTVMVSHQSSSLVQRLSSVSRAKRRQLYREASSPGMAPLHSGVRQEGNNDKFLDTCLIDSLRGLGYKIPYCRDGPFWAKADGDRRCVVAVPIHAMNSRGSFVVCFHEHFEQNHYELNLLEVDGVFRIEALGENASVYAHDVKAGFSVSEGVDSVLVLLDDDCTKDVAGGATFLQTYWATFHGFIVQEGGERRQSASC